MIDLLDIAKEYQSILGDNFLVKIDNEINPSEEKIQCVLTLGRAPFSVRGVDSETFEVALNCYPSINSDMQNANVLYQLSLLTLPINGEIISGTEIYNYDSFLSFRQPTNPVVDTGEFKQVKILTGSLFVTNQASGAILGNNIKIEMYTEEPIPANDLTNIGGELAVTTQTIDFLAIEKSPKKMNDTRATTFLSNKAHPNSIKFFLLPNEICKNIVQYLEDDGRDENTIWWIKRTYEDLELTYTRKVKIKSGSKIQALAGGFAEIILALQILPN